MAAIFVYTPKKNGEKYPGIKYSEPSNHQPGIKFSFLKTSPEGLTHHIFKSREAIISDGLKSGSAFILRLIPLLLAYILVGPGAKIL